MSKQEPEHTEWMSGLVNNICDSYKEEGIFVEKRCRKLPSKIIITEILGDLFKIIFPGYYGKRDLEETTIQYYVGDILDSVYTRLVEEVERALCYWCPATTTPDQCSTCDCLPNAKELVQEVVTKIPEIRKKIRGDVQSAFDGDPAAKSLEEIIVSYPGLYAIATHRLAHELYIEKVPLIPRIMSEHAHSSTGIDIHPGAKIGKNFFTDHASVKQPSKKLHTNLLPLNLSVRQAKAQHSLVLFSWLNMHHTEPCHLGTPL